MIVDRAAAREVFYNRCDPADVEEALGLLGSCPVGPLSMPVTYTAYREIPSTYIVCENDRALSLSVQERMIAQSEGALQVERCQEGHSPFLSNPQFIYSSDLDASIPRIYRTAVARAFSIWRMMIKVKDLIPPNGTTNNKHALPLTSWEIIASTMTAVDDYNHTLRPFMAHCMENYAHLSTESKIYALSVLTFWDLGTLIFAQTLTSILHHPSPNHDSPSSLLPITESQIRTLQETAVISIAQAIGCSLTHPVSHDTFNLQNGLSADLPLTAYLITPILMVTALRLAIETSIELWLGGSGSGSGSAYQAGIIGGGGDDDEDNSVWQTRVDVLVKALLSLEATIGGSQAVTPVLEGLLRRYGDVVSECWSCEFEEVEA